jgi:predicted transport protein
VPIFNISGNTLSAVEQRNFSSEKTLQTLIEKNLQTVFNCRFVASEFSTGPQHAGRIDSLAISEEDNPVTIEYKKVESSQLINQSLFYLNWIKDHRGDFEVAVQKRLNGNVQVDWSNIRVICIAPNYKKYDLHAVQVMGADIELWKYRLFANESLYLEKVLHTDKTDELDLSDNAVGTGRNSGKSSVMVKAGKKAALTRATGTYTFDERLEGKPKDIRELAHTIRQFIIGLDASLEEVPKKFYVAYKISQNVACLEVRSRNIKLFLKLSPTDIPAGAKNYRDVSNIGHYGTGNVEFTVSSEDEFEPIKEFVEMAYNKVGG